MTGDPRSARVAAAIIAGGASRRQGGADKTALLVAGRTILERQLALLAPRFTRVLLVANTAAAPAGVTLLRDRVPGAGPLAGIDAALAALAPDEEAVVCVAGDMPLLAPALLELVRDHAPDAPAVVPRITGRPEPLLARYDRRVAPAIAAALATGAFKAATLVESLAVTWLDEPALRAVDPALTSFENANTPEDLAKICRLAGA